MKSRLIASLALGALVVLGTSGCAMLSTQATTIPYSPSDGVNIPDSGPLQVRNVLIVSDETGVDGNLVAAIVNATTESHTLNIEYGEGSSKSSETIRVPANTTVSLGTAETDPLLLEGIDTSRVPTCRCSSSRETATASCSTSPSWTARSTTTATFCPDARRLTLPRRAASALEAVAESPHGHEHGRIARVLLDA